MEIVIGELWKTVLFITKVLADVTQKLVEIDPIYWAGIESI